MERILMGENTRKVFAYVVNKASRGSYYLRSKNIAEDVSLSPKQVGQELSKINDEYEEVVRDNPDYLEEDGVQESLEWARSRSTTWNVEPFCIDEIFEEVTGRLSL